VPVTRIPIIKGQALYDGDRYLGMMYILDCLGTRQLHSENKKCPTIVALRETRRFIAGERGLTTACYANQKNVKRLIAMLGFKKVGNIKNLLLFRKD
jgi:hypothetical protein